MPNLTGNGNDGTTYLHLTGNRIEGSIPHIRFFKVDLIHSLFSDNLVTELRDTYFDYQLVSRLQKLSECNGPVGVYCYIHQGPPRDKRGQVPFKHNPSTCPKITGFILCSQCPFLQELFTTSRPESLQGSKPKLIQGGCGGTDKNSMRAASMQIGINLPVILCRSALGTSHVPNANQTKAQFWIVIEM